ncbi:MAG TPA: carbohydrate kinase [Actinomycetes bacterium]|nr:carbohydrate kinase [Actinomycetes bacterium]
MFTVLGESLVDVVVTPDGERRAHPGGSPANVAVGLARLGSAVWLLTEIGDDAYGHLLRDHFDANGVNLPVPLESARPTSIAEARIGPTGAATYVFDLRWNAPGTERPLPAGSTHAHTGSIGALLPPGGKKVPGWVEAARGRASVSYDPNVRPALMGAVESARPRVERLVALADVVKASDEDLAWLAPDTPLEEVASSWLDLGPALVVVTRGREGAFVTARSGSFELAPVPVTVVDTVGAGDAFMAGLLDGLRLADLLGPENREALYGASIETFEAPLRRAALVSAYTCSRRGSDPPTVHELEAWAAARADRPGSAFR